MAQIPVSLTWTNDHIYCAISGNHLRVIKVELFRQTSKESSGNIAVPKNEILLPDSSRVREVRYYPPPSEGLPGAVLIGSLNPAAHRHIKEIAIAGDGHEGEELPDVTSPPIGVYVTENDLGGWVSEEGREQVLKGRHGRGGGLERKIERFDAEDDCKFHRILGFVQLLMSYFSGDIEIYIS